MVFQNIYIDTLVKILFAFLCGILLGLERKSKQHTVGMRTLTLICVSSAMLSIISVEITHIDKTGDPTRVAAGVITGIGFLGGGAILQHGLNIKGLTSAAVIWTSAALGLAIGIGQFYVASLTIAISILSLFVLETFEKKYFPARKTKYFILTFENSDFDLNLIQKEIAAAGLIQQDLNLSESFEKEKTMLRFLIKAPGEADFPALSKRLSKTGKLLKIEVTDQ